MPWSISWSACGRGARIRHVHPPTLRRPLRHPWPIRQPNADHEPDARRRAALLAVRPVGSRVPPADRGDLPARLACTAPPRPAALDGRPAGRLPGRPGGVVPGAGVADRTVCGAAAAGPHGAAPAPHDGGATTAVAGGAFFPAVAWPAATDPHLLGRAAVPCVVAASPR